MATGDPPTALAARQEYVLDDDMTLYFGFWIWVILAS